MCPHSHPETRPDAAPASTPAAIVTEEPASSRTPRAAPRARHRPRRHWCAWAVEVAVRATPGKSTLHSVHGTAPALSCCGCPHKGNIGGNAWACRSPGRTAGLPGLEVRPAPSGGLDLAGVAARTPGRHRGQHVTKSAGAALGPCAPCLARDPECSCGDEGCRALLQLYRPRVRRPGPFFRCQAPAGPSGLMPLVVSVRLVLPEGAAVLGLPHHGRQTQVLAEAVGVLVRRRSAVVGALPTRVRLGLGGEVVAGLLAMKRQPLLRPAPYRFCLLQRQRLAQQTQPAFEVGKHGFYLGRVFVQGDQLAEPDCLRRHLHLSVDEVEPCLLQRRPCERVHARLQCSLPWALHKHAPAVP